MNAVRKRRLIGVLVLVAGLAASAAVALMAFRENAMYFNSPTKVQEGRVPAGQVFQLGGMVRKGSVRRESESLRVHFTLTDFNADVNVIYDGILPDLFREGQGIVTDGRLREDGVFVADRVLAKHDENYMSPAVAEALREAGQDPEKIAAEYGRDHSE